MKKVRQKSRNELIGLFMDKIEIHVKQYGITKSKNPMKDGIPIGLETRLIITPPVGAKKIINFDFSHEAKKYINKNYGGFINYHKTFMIINNYELYGKRGYQWT
jgi:hypothetical protein